jgi:hypothetical protein
MLKIIKTSTYTKLVRENSLFRQENMDIRINLKDALAKLAVIKLNDTAKKLPIKKSKNK